MRSIISFVIRYIPRKYLQLVSHFFLRVIAHFYKGTSVSCSVCDHTFKKFLPYGRKARENALCPNCLALERHRLMYLFLKEQTTFFTASLKVLHVAPEICFIERFEALENIDYITADLESPLAKVKMDIHDIPFESESFDVVFCNHVMEHVDDDIRSCAEINRVLKPNGWAIIQSPVYEIEKTIEDKTVIDPKEKERLFGQRDHVRKYGKDYASRISRSGLKVTENNYVKTLSPEIIQKYALPKNEVIFYCTKGY
ncbi:class I SAM-dependent methyltransferase [Anditalea andensis]|uniref:SAM-dependent methyltransferase n=1 Tax=Anditalea andensis TaxID=1048983 RepID=A0A074LKH4_9BACT|nr:class I SAM-dependent methyltransferase [Anditalea andensis]KEO74337.1 SAM-dependent methyltransferase [Anditalea andensis]